MPDCGRWAPGILLTVLDTPKREGLAEGPRSASLSFARGEQSNPLIESPSSFSSLPNSRVAQPNHHR